MKLTWLGHACFRVEAKGHVLIIDPYKDGSVPGLQNIREAAHQVLCSHGHGDHAGEETVTLLPGDPGVIQVERIPSFHDDAQGSLRGPNQIFLLRDGRHTVAHLGDLGGPLTAEQKDRLRNLDAMLIPVGGFFTIGAAQAAQLVQELNPRIAIAMHFRDDAAGFGFDQISTAEPFAKKMAAAAVLPVSQIDLDDRFAEQALILQPRNKISQK